MQMLSDAKPLNYCRKNCAIVVGEEIRASAMRLIKEHCKRIARRTCARCSAICHRKETAAQTVRSLRVRRLIKPLGSIMRGFSLSITEAVNVGRTDDGKNSNWPGQLRQEQRDNQRCAKVRPRPVKSQRDGLRVDWYLSNEGYWRCVQTGAYRDWMKLQYSDAESIT